MSKEPPVSSEWERCFAADLPEIEFAPGHGTALRLKGLDAEDSYEFERRLASDEGTYITYLWLMSRVIQGGTLGGAAVPETDREAWLRSKRMVKAAFDALALECLRVSGYGAALGN